MRWQHLVLVVIAILCMIPMVNATVTTYDFESGNNGSWIMEDYGYGSDYTSLIEVNTRSAHSGNYGVELNGTSELGSHSYNEFKNFDIPLEFNFSIC
jgi:hypothetical protein